MFTAREVEVLDLLIEGLCNTEIADKLSITKFTVKKHLESIYKKMKLHNRVQVSVKYVKMRHNIVD